MYHWRVVTISSGLSPFSKNFTCCTVGRGSPSVKPAASSASTMRSFAVNDVAPAMAAYSSRPASVVIHSGVSGRMRPSQPMIGRVGSCSSRHQVTSVVSPKVQIIAMPDPFSGSARWCASTGTSTPKTGVVTVLPNSGW